MPDKIACNHRMRSTSQALQLLSRELRKQLTPAEATLWAALRDRTLKGIKVRRQYAVDRFILDFYIPAIKLAIEIDGVQHLDQRDRDNERTAMLESRNIRVIRFSNEEVLNDLEAVLNTILCAANDGL